MKSLIKACTIYLDQLQTKLNDIGEALFDAYIFQAFENLNTNTWCNRRNNSSSNDMKNIQQPTSKIQHATSGQRALRWVLKVGCRMFGVSQFPV